MRFGGHFGTARLPVRRSRDLFMAIYLPTCNLFGKQWMSGVRDRRWIIFIQLKAPQGGSTAAPLFILGLLVDGLKANEVPS